MFETSRRRWIQGAGFAGLATAAATLPATSAEDMDFTRTLDFDDPNQMLTGFIKMRGSLEAVDVPHWYYGTIYAAIPGRQPFPIVEFEGSEIDYYEKQEDGSYYAWAKTASFFKDVRTREYLETWDNPVTGKTVEVKPNTINVGDVHYIYSANGFKRSDDPTPLADEPQIQNLLDWSESGPWIWCDTGRTYPPGVPMAEHQSGAGLLKEMHDPDLAQMNTIANPVYISPWLGWMEMGDTPGFAVWTGPARKVKSITDYPKDFLARMERTFPERLTAKPG